MRCGHPFRANTHDDGVGRGVSTILQRIGGGIPVWNVSPVFDPDGATECRDPIMLLLPPESPRRSFPSSVEPHHEEGELKVQEHRQDPSVRCTSQGTTMDATCVEPPYQGKQDHREAPHQIQGQTSSIPTNEDEGEQH